MLKTGKLLIILSFIILSINFLFSEDNKTNEPKYIDNKLVIDTDTAVSLALANNLDLKAEKIKYNSALWTMATSWNVFLPDVSIGATLAKSNLDEDDREINGYVGIDDPTTNFDNTYGVYGWVAPYSVDVPEWGLQANFKLSLNINAAMVLKVYQTALDYHSGKISLDIAKNDLIMNVKKNIYNLILLQNSIEIKEKELKNAQKRYEQAVVLYKNGAKSEYDLLSAEVDYENTKPELFEMKNNYNSAILTFKRMIGIKKNIDILISADLVSKKLEINKDEIINKNLYKSLNLKSFRANIYSLQNARNINISLLTPTFSLGYTMDPTFQKDPMEDDWFGDNEYNEDNWKQKSGMFYMTLTIPLTGFVPFSTTQMDIIKSQFKINELKTNYENLKQNTELKIETIINSMNKSVQSIEVSKLNIKRAERAYQLAEEAYRLGSIELLDVTNAELMLNQAELNLLNEEFKYTSGLLELENLLNIKL